VALELVLLERRRRRKRERKVRVNKMAKNNNGELKVKDLEDFFKRVKKRTGKQPHLKGKGGGTVKLGFD